MTNVRDPLNLVVAGLLFISVSKIQMYIPVLRGLPMAQILVLAAFAYWMMNPVKATLSNLTRWWQSRVIIALVVLACGSVVFGISLGRSASFFLQDYSKVLIFAALLFGTMSSPANLRRTIWAFVLGCVGIVYVSLVVAGISKTASHASYDANDTGLFLVTAFPLAIWLYRTSIGKEKALAGLSTILLLWTIPQSESRGAFVGFVVVLLGLLLWGSGFRAIRRFGVMAVALLVMALAAPQGYGERLESLMNPTEDYNWSAPTGRRQLALRGMGYMLQYPLFGIGVGNFPMAEGQISELAQNHLPGERGIRWAAAHNSYVQVGAEMGIPGLILWTSLVFGSMVSLVRLRKRLPRTWGRSAGEPAKIYHGIAYLVIAWAGFSVCATFVSFAYHDPVYVLAAFTVGMYVSVEQVQHAQRYRFATKARKAAAKLRAPARPGASSRQPTVTVRS
ncbi:MAG: O-antigen ligase family protein [Anaerolineales bacterium]|nr:O-antigen ligase family protein [Anaerolineales bacterium]